jgi:antitoxin (DNA-binding transcriptional repressor) of toxin-antitoxin stability system
MCFIHASTQVALSTLGACTHNLAHALTCARTQARTHARTHVLRVAWRMLACFRCHRRAPPPPVPRSLIQCCLLQLLEDEFSLDGLWAPGAHEIDNFETTWVIHPIPSILACGRRRRPSGVTIGIHRRGRPSAQAVGTGRRHRPSAQAVGTGRRHRPSAQAVGTGRWRASEISSDMCVACLR